jgi:NAD(P)-dependent dehydrogenase (short-subunit alcohol dehydrogenase family)
MTQTLDGRSVLVTGANGGLGEEFVRQALDRGASTVHAAARTPKDWDDDRIVPLALDITDAAAVARAVAAAPDVDLLINNAGIAPQSDSITGPEDELRRIFETNVFGTLRVANAFAPVLAANGGGTLLNVLSTAVWLTIPTGYAASKAAAWSATNALRTALRGQDTQVVGLMVGMVDTAMSAWVDVPVTGAEDVGTSTLGTSKVSAESVVAQAYDGIADGSIEILADAPTRDLKTRLGTPAEELYPWIDGQTGIFVA